MDLLNSKFILEPFTKLDRCLQAYEFLPVKQRDLKRIASVFKTSKIVLPKFVNTDFITEVLPRKFVAASLLFQYTEEAKGLEKELKRFEYLQSRSIKQEKARNNTSNAVGPGRIRPGSNQQKDGAVLDRETMA